MPNTFFTSDTHFGHRNVIAYCSRPWPDVQAMDAGLIERWNARVRPEDVIYHLGDFAFGPFEHGQEILRKLNGVKCLVRGNHDRSVARMLAMGFSEVIAGKTIDLELDGFRLRLRHYPRGGHNGDRPEPPPQTDYLLCGHVHEKWVHRGSEINVGVDVWDWEPKLFEELANMNPPGIYPDIDWANAKHHGEAK